MPRLSAFYGIVIAMYYRDHAPPHFHATYGEDEATVAIGASDLLSGWLPPRALKLVREWAAMHLDELEANWQRARQHRPLSSIELLR
jgi:hypothetical protein